MLLGVVWVPNDARDRRVAAGPQERRERVLDAVAVEPLRGGARNQLHETNVSAHRRRGRSVKRVVWSPGGDTQRRNIAMSEQP